MAIKERKQITGTTAQINAYEGHEGQIVWDKEKKTFVGMSGTAGKNYPLAPKEYVDNEVAKVNTELQKTNAEVAKKQPKGDYATNAQLTEGLAGKEDKGTCLPLSGGNISGQLHFYGVSRIQRIHNENLLEICGGNEWNTGAVVRLYDNDYSVPGWEGACSMASGLDDVLVITNGALSFNALRVPTLVSWHVEHIGVIGPYSGGTKVFNFQPPKNASRIIVPIIRTNMPSGYAGVNFGYDNVTSTSAKIAWWNNGQNATGDIVATIFFITEGGVRN